MVVGDILEDVSNDPKLIIVSHLSFILAHHLLH